MIELFIFMVFMAFGLAPIFLGPYLAKKKNRSALKAFLITFFFGWIGVAVVLFLEEKQVCQKCNAKFPATHMVCSVCGHKKV